MGVIMNITPLYELRTRLKNVMIAGTNLIAEDFRLKRAVESFKPLAGIAPVFTKIDKLINELLEPERADKEMILLEVLSLLDAVLCTQAKVSVDKPISNIPKHQFNERLKNIPYSIIRPLINALMTSGSGHFSYVEALHTNQPELFLDYRVKLAMIQALGASYDELARLVQEWLEEESNETIFPLLQFGFDAKGKKEMVRRVEIIDAVCGAKANDFYCSMIPKSGKNVREVLIYALRHEPKNLELLLSLAKSETGKTKNVAYSVLANFEDEVVSEFFKERYQKKPKETVNFLYLSKTAWASELVAKYLKEKLAEWEKNAKETGTKFIESEKEWKWGEVMRLLLGKSGIAIKEAIMQTVELADSFGLPVKRMDIHEQYRLFYFTTSQSSHWLDALGQGENFHAYLAHFLMYSLRVNPTSELFELAFELYERYGEENERNPYFSLAATAKLLSEEDCFEWFHERISLIKKQVNSPYGTELEKVFKGVSYDGEKWKMTTRISFSAIGSGHNEEKTVFPICQKMDALVDILIKCNHIKTDKILMELLSSNNPELCARLEPYFYNRALVGANPEEYVEGLKKCGCNHCEGLLVHAMGVKKRTMSWIYHFCLRKLPGNRKAKEEEVRRVLELLEEQKLKIYDKWDEKTKAGFMNIIKEFELLEKIEESV